MFFEKDLPQITLDYVIDCTPKKIFNTGTKDVILERRFIFRLRIFYDTVLKRERQRTNLFTCAAYNCYSYCIFDCKIKPDLRSSCPFYGHTGEMNFHYV